IQVGKGARGFSVKARDVGGHEVETPKRTIWLSLDGSGPPVDNQPPEIIVESPANNATLKGNATIDIVAQIADDNDIGKAELTWSNQGQDFAVPCPLDAGQIQNVSCEVNAHTYTWHIDA